MRGGPVIVIIKFQIKFHNTLNCSKDSIQYADLTNLYTDPSADYMSFIIGKSETGYKIISETATYPFALFISDVGGAAGLILGLNILGILRHCSESKKK
jgi:hypothetical protein